MLVGGDDHQPSVLECLGHVPGADERRRGVACRADDDDRAGAFRIDFHRWRSGHWPRRAELQLEDPTRAEAGRHLGELALHVEHHLRILGAGVVETVDREVRLELVSVRAVGTALVVTVVQREDPVAVAVLQVCERSFELGPGERGVHRVGDGGGEHALGHVGSTGTGFHRGRIRRRTQRVERAGGVAAVGERTVRTFAAIGEEGVERALEARSLLQVLLQIPDRLVRSTIDHHRPHGRWEQARPRDAELAAVAEPEVADFGLAESSTDRVHVAGRVSCRDEREDLRILGEAVGAERLGRIENGLPFGRGVR